MRRLMSVACLLSVCLGCGAAPAPTAPTPPPPPVPACQANNTATMTFGNRTVTNRTYTVVLDGGVITTLPPGQTSAAVTVAAGVQHTVRFLFTNTTLLACAEGFPVPAQCSTATATCGT